MKQLILPQFGLVVEHQGSKSVNAQHNSLFFADGEPRVKSLMIFVGTGKLIKLRERVQYDTRVSVMFQSNARCDEVVMGWCVKNSWKPHIKEESLLLLDLDKGQLNTVHTTK